MLNWSPSRRRRRNSAGFAVFQPDFSRHNARILCLVGAHSGWFFSFQSITRRTSPDFQDIVCHLFFSAIKSEDLDSDFGGAKEASAIPFCSSQDLGMIRTCIKRRNIGRRRIFSFADKSNPVSRRCLIRNKSSRVEAAWVVRRLQTRA